MSGQKDSDLQALLQDGLRAHQAGRLADAEALGNLGNVLLAQGRPDDAVASYRKALLIASDDAEIHANSSAFGGTG